MALTECDSTSAATWDTLDLSLGITAGSTEAILSVKNTSDIPIKFHFRQTGSSDDENRDISPGEYKQIVVQLTSARTLEGYVEGGGSVTVYAVLSIGSGLVVSTVTIADIRTTLLDSGYSTADISDVAIQGYIDLITIEATDAATRHANIAGFTLNTGIKTNAIKMGALWMTLNLIINIAASHGIVQDKINASAESTNTYQAKYSEILEGIKSGIKYGA